MPVSKIRKAALDREAKKRIALDIMEPNISELVEESHSSEDTDEEGCSGRKFLARMERQEQREKEEDRLRQKEFEKGRKQRAVEAEQASQQRELARAEDEQQHRLNGLCTEKDRAEAIVACFYQCGCNAEAFGWQMLDTACQDFIHLNEEIEALEAP